MTAEQTSSLVVFEKAALMLAEANTIQKARELKSLALTAADWARRKGMGEDAIQHCRSYALEAERKMGEMLRETERAKGTAGAGRPKLGGVVTLPPKQEPTLKDIGLTKRESSQAQQLAAMPAKTFEAVKLGKITRVEAMDNHRAQGTGENEWYTPAQHIKAVRAFLGEIDVDPASSEQAQKTVKAARYFTVDDDGLKQAWKGRVFLNPPYAQPHIANFMHKLAGEVACKNTSEAIALTHNYTDTAWFHAAAGACAAICFTRGRIAFVDPSGKAAAKPTQGQAFLYFGKRAKEFGAAFAALGLVMFR